MSSEDSVYDCIVRWIGNGSKAEEIEIVREEGGFEGPCLKKKKKHSEGLCFSADSLTATIKRPESLSLGDLLGTGWRGMTGSQRLSGLWRFPSMWGFNELLNRSLSHREQITGKTSILRANETPCWNLTSFANTLRLFYLLFGQQASCKGLV